MIDAQITASVSISLGTNGHLEFRIPPPFECSFRFSSWQSGLIYERFENGSWQPETLDCGFPLLELAESQNDKPDVIEFLGQIPDSIRERAEGFRYAQATLLHWIAANSSATELFESVPTLIWLLIARQQAVEWPDDHVARLLRSPRTKILSAISGVGQRSGLTWLKKIELGEGDSREHEVIINALRSEFYRSPCGQEPKIPIHWVKAAAEFPQLANTRAFHGFCKQHPKKTKDFSRDLRQNAKFWVDALNVARMIDIADAEIALNRCIDFTAMRRLHDRWTDRLNQRQALVVHGATPFPEPPIPGNANIHPITTLEDLQAEGRLMHHCVAVYEAPIRQGGCYIYRILQPERATVELRFSGNQVRVGQVQLAYNGRPSTETRVEIDSWLLAASKRVGSA